MSQALINSRQTNTVKLSVIVLLPRFTRLAFAAFV